VSQNPSGYLHHFRKDSVVEFDLLSIISQIPVTTIIDYLGVMVGVIAGTLFAIDREMDIMGAVSLGLVTGFGGGVIRDLLLQNQGIFFMEHPMYVLASICLSMALSLGRRHLTNFYKYLFHLDAFTMAWYVLAGASKSWFAGSGAVISIILGSVTAVGGGALRDICTGEIPRVFLPGKYYGVSSVIAAACYVIPVEFGAPQDISSILCVAVGYALTVLSERFNWHTHGGSAPRRDCERCGEAADE
jgi:uncharacterized membrane protein YeiH